MMVQVITYMFRMTTDQAKELWDNMAKAYIAKKESSWPAKFDRPFKKEEDGSWTFKAKLKGAYGSDATRKPTQYDAKGVKPDDDFLLTTGSKVNIAMCLVPYNMREAGVSLRLRAVQVIKYKPMKEKIILLILLKVSSFSKKTIRLNQLRKKLKNPP